MMRTSGYRPRLLNLEDRLAPGSVFAPLEPSVMSLGPAFSLGDQDFLSATSSLRVAAGTSSSVEAGAAAVNADAVPIMQASSALTVQSPVLSASAPHTQGWLGLTGGDTVTLGILPASSIRINQNQTSLIFGDDPPVITINNVFIASDGTVSASQADFNTPSFQIVASGLHFDIQYRAQSDLSGTYDRSTGAATFSFMQDTQVTSQDAPGFDNNNCILPATTLNFDTGNAGDPQDPPGAAFSGGEGRAVDNTFTLGEFPHGMPGMDCGGIPGIIDYGDSFNSGFHVPSPNPGDNFYNLHLRMDPSIGP